MEARLSCEFCAEQEGLDRCDWPVLEAWLVCPAGLVLVGREALPPAAELEPVPADDGVLPLLPVLPVLAGDTAAAVCEPPAAV